MRRFAVDSQHHRLALEQILVVALVHHSLAGSLLAEILARQPVDIDLERQMPAVHNLAENNQVAFAA